MDEKFNELMDKCHSNFLSKGLLLVQKAAYGGEDGTLSAVEQKKLMEVMTKVMFRHIVYSITNDQVV